MTLTEPPQTLPPAGPGQGGRRRGPRTPKGRQVDPQALAEIRSLLGGAICSLSICISFRIATAISRLRILPLWRWK